jgi:predicted metal-dependent peptidase
MSTKNKEALDKMIRARTSLFIFQPFYGCLSMQLELVEENRQPTMAVDATHLYYNTKFVSEITAEELLGVNVHEVLHPAYKHHTRRGNRDPMIWNIAADFRINTDVIDAGFVLPGIPRTWAEVKQGEEGYMYDPKLFKDMSSEEIYAYIMADLEKQRPDGKGGKMKLPKKGGKAGEGDADVPGDVGGCGAVMDAYEPGDQAGRAEAEAQWDTIVRQAVMVARAANAGTIPGNIARLVDELMKPRVPWQDVLRRWVDNSITPEPSWSRPNRRFVSTGDYLPGRQRGQIEHLIVVGDISGSANDEMLKGYASEINYIFNDLMINKITLIYVDTEVRKVDVFEQGDEFKFASNGGGGTDFKTTFEWIRANSEDDVVGILFFTDLYTSDFGKPPHQPVLWLHYGTEAEYKVLVPTVPFGDTLHINT